MLGMRIIIKLNSREFERVVSDNKWVIRFYALLYLFIEIRLKKEEM